VIGVCDDAALLADAAGNEYEEERQVNEFLFQDCSCKGHVAGRLDEAGRADNLKAFLTYRAQQAQATAEDAANSDGQTVLDAQQQRATQPSAGADAAVETQKEVVMKAPKKEKKVKAVKSFTKAEKSKRASEQSAKVQVSYAGRPEFIANLIAKGEKDAAIMVAVKEAYPGSSKCNVIKTIASKRAKAKADAKGE
jgi:hypothetical protein